MKGGSDRLHASGERYLATHLNCIQSRIETNHRTLNERVEAKYNIEMKDKQIFG